MDSQRGYGQYSQYSQSAVNVGMYGDGATGSAQNAAADPAEGFAIPTPPPVSPWTTTGDGGVGGMANGAIADMHHTASSPLEYGGRDITAQLRNGTLTELAPGTLVLGRFYVERALGKGGMSNVYLAQDYHFEPPNNRRSLKEMISGLDDPTRLSNFKREANVLARLRHPRIPRVFDYFTIYQRAYLVLDYIEGTDLEAKLEESQDMLAPEMVVDWMLQLCDIVEYLHTQPHPIIFRDLKPNNIILTLDGHIVLIDFGIAKLLSGGRDTNVGTPGYAANEMYGGHADTRSDIFALGAMMHHLLTRQDPRKRDLFTFHRHPIRRYNPAVPPELAAVVMRCVEQEMDKRYQTIREVRQALEEVYGYSAKRTTTDGIGSRPIINTILDEHNVRMAPSYTTTQIWRYQTEDEVRATPAVDGNTVYIGSYDHNVHAVDRMTGRLKWKFATDGGVCVTPALWQNDVLIGSQDFNIYAIDCTTGKEDWRYRTWQRVHSSPRIFDNRLYIGSDDTYIHAIEPRTGVMIWHHQTFREIWSSAAYDNGVVFIGSSDNSVYAVDALTGEFKWRFQAQGSVISSPIVVDGNVFFGSKDFGIYCLDSKTGWQAWRTPTDGGVISSPLIVGDRLYIGSADKHLYCLDRHTGHLVWKYATGGQVNSSPAFADGALFFGSNDRTVYSLDLEGKLRWRFTTGGIVPGSPVVRDGVVYIGSADGCLYALRANG